jgi:hypothetical protein
MSRNEWLAATFLALPLVGSLILAGAYVSWWIPPIGVAGLGCLILGEHFANKRP